MSKLNVNWDDVIKKEARGIDDADMGEVQDVEKTVVVTKKGIFDKYEFYLPKRLIERYDGRNLFFKVTRLEADKYRRHEEFL